MLPKIICSSLSYTINTSMTKLTLCFCIILVSIYSYLYGHPQVDIMTTRPTKTIMKSPLINDDNSFAHVDEFAKPSRQAKVEERIKRVRAMFEDSGILESTAKTRDDHEKIATFLGQGNDTNTNRCKIQFFLTWISPDSFFSTRDMLTLESIFKSHPEGCVVILSKSMASEPGRKMVEPLISRGYRVLVVTPDFHLLFNNTPAIRWLERLESGSLDPGAIPINQNLSNLLRLVALYKYGGVYIDADVIILKDFSRLRNAIGIQELEDGVKIKQTNLNNAVLIFDKGHPLLFKFIDEFARCFNGNRWGYNGPALVTRVTFNQTSGEKFDVNILPMKAFYPVDWFEIAYYFQKLEGPNATEWALGQLKQLSSSYALHIWNKGSNGIKLEQGSLLGKVFSDVCIVCQNIYS